MNNLGLFFLKSNLQLIFWIPFTASSLPWLIPGFVSCNNPVMTCVSSSILYLTKLYWLSRSTILPQINTSYNFFFLVNNPTENNFVCYTLTFAKVNLAKKFAVEVNSNEQIFQLSISLIHPWCIKNSVATEDKVYLSYVACGFHLVISVYRII